MKTQHATIKNDLTHYGERELYSWFMNDEGLYNIFINGVELNNFYEIQEIATEFFLFTPEQMDDLQEEFHSAVESGAH